MANGPPRLAAATTRGRVVVEPVEARRMAGTIHTIGASLDAILNPLAATVNDTLQTTSNFLTSPKTHRAIVRSIIFSGVIIFSICAAVIGYLSFYWLYIPELGLSQPAWLQYGQGRPPFAIVPLKGAGELASDQPYDITLDLLVPASERNIELGNFMVTVELKSADNTTILRASRPASLAYESALVRSLHALTNYKTLLSFSRSQIQYINVRLVDSAILQHSGRKKIANAIVEVGRWDSHQLLLGAPSATPVNPNMLGSQDQAVASVLSALLAAQSRGSTINAGELQVYESTLRFDAHFEGLRYIMYNYPKASFIVFTSIFTFWEIFAALSAWAVIAYRRGTITPFDAPSYSRVSGSSTGYDDGKPGPGMTSSGMRRIKRDRERAQTETRRRFDEIDREEALEREKIQDAYERRRSNRERMDPEPAGPAQGSSRDLGIVAEASDEDAVKSEESWEGMEAASGDEETETEARIGQRIKREADTESEGTVGGSASSRAQSRRSLGSSRATSRTVTSASAPSVVSAGEERSSASEEGQSGDNLAGDTTSEQVTEDDDV
ncbi:uncharacterized protein L969DRAFT_43656 [Mixia osmundae IAM 14324]|uniref:Seipin n=1 Tax=Mixia osmundae (strain CBS 9802 / IAM 14324 / JCM 22182 / KY 12970) TaxID=764103 RepID=G7E4L2_MIXOS|nr:uncharacterized protein L969DRAFT_43656 [Mixia osmundae IAM 14324]KEI41848.1 hypothetical protein L969DRAFT_43656 [Mixia osmundae IAM 14324]GAA97772.1 hypothetical protein E5Q_04451 [Mixia osmundae IAM 14324]